MAKSKNGGTRSYLRGRIASDVYSIGKDSKGNKQQVVRSLAETVANPQTTAQMRGRMIMSTVMQAVSGLSQLIDHSFDNVAVGQPNISEFIRRNYALIKADAAAHPAEGNSFGLVQYGEKGAKAGKYVLSAGSAILPAVVQHAFQTSIGLSISGVTATSTAKDVRDALGMGVDDYITVVAIKADGTVQFIRFHIDSALADDTVITTANAAELFDIDNPFGVALTATIADGSLKLQGAETDVVAYGVIFTQKVTGKFTHSDSVMAIGATVDYPANVALLTYPVGNNKFLNGGELGNGSSTSSVTPGQSTPSNPDDEDDGPSAGGGSGEVG